jgi:hypothetical protein
MTCLVAAVPLDPSDPGARDGAYREALDRVLIRVTGSADPGQLEGLAEVFPNPARYVLRYRPGPDNTLQVSFDGAAIEKILRQTQHTIWSADRPETLVWLAVDWGQGEREIIGADTEEDPAAVSRSIDRDRQLRERVISTAEYRGVPVLFPLLDSEDLSSISFSDIWGGFDQRLLDASQRYGTSSVLVGRVRAGSAQQTRWTYYFGNEQFSWTGEPEAITNRVADTLVATLAVQGDAALETFALRINGIDSVDAFGSVQQMMDRLGVIEDYALHGVSGRTLEYRVSVYGGIDRLNSALELSGILQPSTTVSPDINNPLPVGSPNQLIFDYQP